jgi:hypothetical protein
MRNLPLSITLAVEDDAGDADPDPVPDLVWVFTRVCDEIKNRNDRSTRSLFDPARMPHRLHLHL